MNTKRVPRELAKDLLARSKCRVQVAAVLSDGQGIFAWGWNNSGEDGYGMHAEEHAFKRANKKRLKGACLTIAAQNRNSGNTILAKPCNDRCLKLVVKFGISKVEYTTKSGKWKKIQT